MLKKFSFIFLLVIFTGFTFTSLAQDGIKVVPIGETVKPEAPKKKKRRYRPRIIKPGTSFLVELGTALSSGLSKEGEEITIYAAEDVKIRGRAGIVMGAPGTAKVTEVNKKEKKVVATLEEIEGNNGESISISGTISLQGEKDAATAFVGEKYTATVDEKVVVKRKRRKKSGDEKFLIAFAQISGKDAEADLKDGKAKGRVELILDPPKGFTADDIKVETVAMAKVNDKDLEKPVLADAKDPKQGDYNKNGTTDWKMYFDTWEFIKNQPEGMNAIFVRGQLKNGRAFEAMTRVKIDY